MKLDYNILWIDDDDSWLTVNVPCIEEHMLDKGFASNIVRPINQDALDAELEKLTKKNTMYDLFVVDYNLSSLFSENGNGLISNIRNPKTDKKIYTNIVFYSSDIEKARRDLGDNCDGIYFFDRTDLEVGSEAFKDLIDFFLTRDMDMSSLRGIAMQEVAQFDEIIRDILKEGDHIKYILGSIQKQASDVLTNVSKYKVEKLQGLIDKGGTSVYNSTLRKNALHKKILKQCEQQHACTESCYENILERYGKEVIKWRNHLAHHLMPEINEKENLKFRKTLIEFRKVFKKIQECPKRKLSNK